VIKFRAKCIKSFFWNNHIYREGDDVEVTEPDLHILTQAEVIVYVDQVETQMMRPPENRKARRNDYALHTKR
jgi:hypothetical protein